MNRARSLTRNRTASATSDASIHGTGSRLPARALGDLLRGHPLHRREAVVERAVDAGRVDRDDPDAVRRELDRPRLGQPGQAPLGRRVVRQAAHPAQAGDRRVVDDHAGLRLDHVRDHVPGDDPGALEVDVEHRVPLGLGQLVGEPVRADAGVVEQDVDPAEALDRVVDRLGHRGVVADVGDDGQAGAARSLDRRPQRVQLLGRAHRVRRVGERRGDVQRDDVVAVLRQRERRRAALAVGGAGDEGDAHAA